MIQGFKYPEDDLVLKPEWALDFLRSLDGYPELVDPNYIRNQRDAVNYFLEWFRKPGIMTYHRMLCNHHSIASLGLNLTRPYWIRYSAERHLTVESYSTQLIRYRSSIPDDVRDVYPGKTRRDLEIMGIPHPINDSFYLPDCKNQIFEEIKSQRMKDPKIRVRCEGGNFAIMVNSEGCFSRSAPVGFSYDSISEYCVGLMGRMQNDYLSITPEDIAEYYHAAINWMPFSHINNSIFMGHVNAILRLMNRPLVSHSHWDHLALVTNYDQFISLAPFHIAKENILSARL
jgi:hypothetical protein